MSCPQYIQVCYFLLTLLIKKINFSRLIIIAEKTTVYEKFPTPLINRLEKHFVLYSSVLEDWQAATLKKMEQWINYFSHVENLDR